MSSNEKAKELAIAIKNPMEEAKALLEQEKQARVKRCEGKINQALQEERCTLDVSVVISARGNQPQLAIVAQD